MSTFILVLVPMLMFTFMIIVLVVMAFFSPMMMNDPKSLKQPFNDEKKEYCADEDKRYKFAIRSWVFICVWQDVDDCISDDGSTSERVK